MTDDRPKPGSEVEYHSAVPVFLVADVNATVQWYAQHLGFRTTGLFPPNPPASWAAIERDRAELMFQRLPGHRNPDLYASRRGGVWDAYVRTRGVKALYESVRGNAFIKAALRQQPYGSWEFELIDPNGYVLVFGE